MGYRLFRALLRLVRDFAKVPFIHTIVEKDIAFLEFSQHTLLLVLLDRVSNFARSDLEFFTAEK